MNGEVELKQFMEEFKKSLNDSSFASQVKEAREKGIEDRKKQSRIPHYGYDMVKGQLTVNEVEAEIVKWIFTTMQAYSDNPPASLVNEVIETYRNYYDAELDYDTAKEKVSYSRIVEYITDEINHKNTFYECATDKSLEELKRVLLIPIEDVKKALGNLAPDERSLDQWKRRMKKLYKNELYIGKIFMSSYGDGKSKPETFVVDGKHEAIISPELFEAVQNKMKQ